MTKENNWCTLLVAAVVTVEMVTNLCNRKKSCYEEITNGYCGFLGSERRDAEKTGYNEDAVVAVVDRNEGDSNDIDSDGLQTTFVAT
eukprot:CAMPEP_0194361250 /NCGR_PEP_ID=MMETSP0174-20130528/8830_1 /TAXON_ID=216777 /ORGANISM="Proboscia alata, Strain PI-D3" /LENGTH=86 /DNA_ID=CAMNT_0039133355 /DNA_START=79 /DNA_END=340 /DNA_ORIENTATION=+